MQPRGVSAIGVDGAAHTGVGRNFNHKENDDELQRTLASFSYRVVWRAVAELGGGVRTGKTLHGRFGLVHQHDSRKAGDAR